MKKLILSAILGFYLNLLRHSTKFNKNDRLEAYHQYLRSKRKTIYQRRNLQGISKELPRLQKWGKNTLVYANYTIAQKEKKEAWEVLMQHKIIPLSILNLGL